MTSHIRKMMGKDKEIIIEMMEVFYASPAVFTNGSIEIFTNDVEACINENPYLEGFVMENDNEIQGYMMIAKSFSTEFGKLCIWIEDLYIKEEYRGMGLGNQFMTFVEKTYKNCIYRLEVEKENEIAVSLYKKHGFDILPYTEMKK